MPRLFFMANSVHISNNPLCASRITAYRGEFGRVRGKACCCCCCLASNSLYKSRLIEQQSAFTQQRLSVEQKKKLFCSVLHIWKIQKGTGIFQGGKHIHVSIVELIFYSKALKLRNPKYSQNDLYFDTSLYICKSMEGLEKDNQACITIRKLVTVTEDTSYITKFWETAFFFSPEEAQQSQGKCDISFRAFFLCTARIYICCLFRGGEN